MKLAEVGRLTRPMYVKSRKPNSEDLALNISVPAKERCLENQHESPTSELTITA
jgi:hypothetical protein